MNALWQHLLCTLLRCHCCYIVSCPPRPLLLSLSSMGSLSSLCHCCRLIAILLVPSHRHHCHVIVAGVVLVLVIPSPPIVVVSSSSSPHHRSPCCPLPTRCHHRHFIVIVCVVIVAMLGRRVIAILLFPSNHRPLPSHCRCLLVIAVLLVPSPPIVVFIALSLMKASWQHWLHTLLHCCHVCCHFHCVVVVMLLLSLVLLLYHCCCCCVVGDVEMWVVCSDGVDLDGWYRHCQRWIWWDGGMYSPASLHGCIVAAAYHCHHVMMWAVRSDGVRVDGCASLSSPTLDHGSCCFNEMGPGWWQVCERMVAATPIDEYR